MKSRIVLFLAITLVSSCATTATEIEEPATWKPDANAERSTVPDIYKWDLSPLVAGEEAWEDQALEAEQMLTTLEKLRSGLSTADGLIRYLTAYFEADELINRITLYANLQRDVDAINQEAISRHQRALQMTQALMAEGPTLRQAILGMSDQELVAGYLTFVDLTTFRPFIRQLRRRAAHVLGPEGEEVLALAGDNLWAQIDLNELPSVSETAFSALISEMALPKVLGEDGAEVQLTFSNYGLLRGSSDRAVRREAVAGMFNTLRGYENTFAATLGGQAAFTVFLARARGYDAGIDAYLAKDDIDPAVYRNLITTVRAHASLLHRYISLRKQVMDLDEVHLYDLYVPLAEGVARDISFSEASELILDALEPLGETYLERLAEGLDPASGWIDLYPSKNKQSGAFSSAVYGVHPFIKMNYLNRYDDMSTLAHEFGHALHSDLSMETQSYLTWRYPPFLAEIASTCNEMLLSQSMVEKATSDAEKAWLLSELIETIRTTIFRQTLFADFELQVHELVEAGEPVTAERLNSIYRELLEVYYGPDYSIDANDAIEWAYIPHFYYKYYVFTYATGLTSGIALSERIQSGVPGAQEAYLDMLRGGSSRPPIEMLQSAGVDLTQPAPIEAAMAVFARTLDELEKLLQTK